eukprot:Seg3571.2 transcript_id=Seg3571.2/GoldUCD/mRNA.D3Y31 product="hypothetical protein" protein_id=Seg3571.2/GoldUCD/D3Y31
MDRTKYRRLIPVYIANMCALKESDPQTWEAFMNGEFCVKKSQIPFTGIGVDHGGEEVIKTLKIEGGLVGIANTENARLRFFLTAPLLANIVQDVLSHGNSAARKRHHLDSKAAMIRHREMHIKLLAVLKEKSAVYEDFKEDSIFTLKSNAFMPPATHGQILGVEKDRAGSQ